MFRLRRELAIGALAVLVLASPALFTDRQFDRDHTNHVWLIATMGRAIADLGTPSIFLHATNDFSFEPYFGFYGGTLYAMGGAVSALFGDAPVLGFRLLVVLGFAMAWAGMRWLAALGGLRGLAGHAPAIVYTTAPYLLTDLFSRGAWPEFMALSALPLVAAGLVHHLRPGTLRAGPVAGFLLGVVLFTGSHNITLLWGTITLALLGAALVVAAPRQRLPALPLIVRTVALGLLGVAVNAWFLGLDLLHAGDTIIAQAPFSYDAAPRSFQSWDALLDPFRRTAPGSATPGLTTALPVLALLWVAGAAALVGPRADQAERRRWIALAVLFVALLVAMRSPGVWDALGKPFTQIQFVYRIGGYLALLAALLVLVTLRLGTTRVTRVALAGVCALSVVGGVVQVWDLENQDPETHRTSLQATLDRSPPGTLPQPEWVDPTSYADGSRPKIDPPQDRNLRLIPRPRPGVRSWTFTGPLPPGNDPIATDIAAGPYVVRLSGGVRAIGRTLGGRMVVQRIDGGAPGVPVRIRVEQVGSLALRGGAVVSVLALLASLVLVTTLVVRELRRRGRVAGTTAGSVRL